MSALPWARKFEMRRSYRKPRKERRVKFNAPYVRHDEKEFSASTTADERREQRRLKREREAAEHDVAAGG